MEWFVLLTYFDRKIGPRLFLSYPEQMLKKETSLNIADLMDQVNSEEFFSYSFNNLHTLNYYFEIPSHWARGNKELLMISTVFDHQPSSETRKTIFSLCIEFSEWLKLKEGIFTAFYSDYDTNKYRGYENIALNRYHIKLWLKEFYWTVKEELQEKLEEENIILLLDERDILETLDYLTRGSISLEDLKTWYIDQFPDKNIHKLMNSLLRTHMVNITKKSPYTITISKEMKTIIKLIITKNRLIKQFLQNNLQLHPFEEETQELHDFLKKVFATKQASIRDK